MSAMCLADPLPPGVRALPAPWRAVMLAAQAGFYALALADGWIPGRSKWKRVSAPLRTFVTLVAAAMLAWSILFTPGSRLWKPVRTPAPEPGPDLAAAGK